MAWRRGERMKQRLEIVGNPGGQRGWIMKPRQLYLGFSRLLQALTHQLKRSRATSFNDGDDIALFFDKPRCQNHLAKAGLSVPVSFGPAADYAAVRAHLRATGRL